MGFIVYNKNTCGYLKSHSGSFSNFEWMTLYRLTYTDRVSTEEKEMLSPYSDMKNNSYFKNDCKDDPHYKEYMHVLESLIEKSMFSAPPEKARVYISERGALNSVGLTQKVYSPKGKWRRNGESFDYKHILPDHLEIHEIKEVKLTEVIPISK